MSGHTVQTKCQNQSLVLGDEGVEGSIFFSTKLLKNREKISST